jgi:WD40 repeat protein
MRTFHAGDGRVHQLSYTPDGKCLVVDLRGKPQQHPNMGFDIHPAHELVCWDWSSGQSVRRFRLRDSLYGPGGACRAQAEEMQRDDWQPDGPAFDVSWCFDPWRIATAWEWSNKEDGNCVYDADERKCIDLRTPYKTHTMRLALAPDGNALAAATVNDMDGSGLIECWSLTPKVPADPDSDYGGRKDWLQERIQSTRVDAVELNTHPTAYVFDGRFVAVADPRSPQVQLWDTTTPVDSRAAALSESDPEYNYGPIRRADGLEPGFVTHALALGVDHLLAVGGVGIALWKPVVREWRRGSEKSDTITAIAFDANATRLIVGTASGNLGLWDVATMSELRCFGCSIGPIQAVAFAPDGLTCAAGGENGQVVVWDVGS